MTRKRARKKVRNLRSVRKGPTILGNVLKAVNRYGNKLRKKWFVSLLRFLVLVLATAGTSLRDLIRRPPIPVRQTDFSVVLRTESHGPGTMLITSSDPKEVSPTEIDAAFDWVVTNIGNTTNQVVDYSIVAKSSDQTIWLQSISLRSPQYLVIRNANAPEYIDVSHQSFDNVARSRLLAPGDSVSGCAFFKIKHANHYRLSFDTIQIVILDAYGTRHVIAPRRITQEEYQQMVKGG